jgi:hypothetical protein
LPLVKPCFFDIVDIVENIQESLEGSTFSYSQVSLWLWHHSLLGPLLIILLLVALCLSLSKSARSIWRVPELPVSVEVLESI